MGHRRFATCCLGSAALGLASIASAQTSHADCLEPQLCQPGNEAEVFTNGFTSGSGVNEITLAFDSSVPEWVQDYILDYWEDLEGYLNTTVGPPSGTYTVTVDYEPNLGFAGSYSYGTNRLRFRTLPIGYNERYFNATFAHEMVHAYNDAALEQGFTSWCAEGVAVAATAIVQEAIRPLWLLDQTDRSLAQISTGYDNVSQCGAEAIGGTGFLATNVAPVRSYLAAGGVFWFLTVAQDSALAGQWSQYTYLSRLLAEVYDTGSGLTSADVHAAIGATAPRPVDGLDAVEWTQAQPVTVTSVPAGTYVYANLAQPFLDSSSITGLEYQVFGRSSSGTVGRLFHQPVEISVYDLSGALVCSMEHTATPGGVFFGYQFVHLCDAVRDELGAYTIEIDASAYGAGTLALAGSSVGAAALGYDATQGSGVVFFDPATQRVAARPFATKGAFTAGSWSGAHVLLPLNLWFLPSTVRVSLFSLSLGGPPAFDRTMPLPYRRVMRLDL